MTVPKLTVQELLPPPPKTAHAAILPYLPKGRSQRGGFWTIKPCVICGTFFETRRPPNHPTTKRCTCSRACSVENRRRHNIAKRIRYLKRNPKKRRQHTRNYRKRHPEKISAQNHRAYERRKARKNAKN